VSDARNSLTARDSHIWTLRMGLLIVIALLFAQTFVQHQRQNDITVHVPPDLSKGVSLEPGKLQPANSYAFASFVWSGINDWPDSGKVDYEKAINDRSCFMSYEMHQYLLRNLSEKKSAGELDRTRSLSPLLQYRQGFSQPIGNNSFGVALVMRLIERVGSMSVKDTGMRYAFRVTPDTRPCNPYGMQLDGFMEDPARYEVPDENKKIKGIKQ
jgi:integrating conjugative element protein (TIGR03746 family)